MFWLFAFICFVSVFFIIFVVPETQGKTLEDIERLYIEHIVSTIEPYPPSPCHRTKRSGRRLSSIANLKATPSTLL